MCIPLLAAVIATTLFFGWAMMHQQHVKASARYTSWRRVYGDWHVPANVNANDPNTQDDPNYPGLNQLFFRNEGAGIHVDGWGGPTDEFEQLVGAAGQHSQYAQDLADRLILNPLPDRGHFQHARWRRVSASFPSEVGAFRAFQGDIRASHIRDGVEWRRKQADCRHVVREQFLLPLDSTLDAVQPPGDGLARMMRSLYRNGW